MIRLYRILKLLVVFLREFVVSVLRVAWLVMSPRMAFTPAAFRFPLRTNRVHRRPLSGRHTSGRSALCPRHRCSHSPVSMRGSGYPSWRR